MTKLTLGFKKSGVFVPVVQDYAAPGSPGTTYTTTISPPAGATKCQIECYGTGGGRVSVKGTVKTGSGGCYAKLNEHAIASLGYTALYLSVSADNNGGGAGADTFVKANSAGGTTLCLAKGGSTYDAYPPSGNVGNVTYIGGRGVSSSGTLGAGGAAGPSGNGGNASGATQGTSGGGLAGAGGAEYGGGQPSSGDARRGIIRITWS